MFGWAWIIKETEWKAGLAQLWEYAVLHKTVALPWWHVTERGFNLGAWVVRQQHAYQEGTLSARQQRALEGLPGWVWRTTPEIESDL